MSEGKTYSIAEALRAQRALREAAGLKDERFPVEAFVGMISDEIQTLRSKGKTDNQIVEIIRSTTSIDVSDDEIRKFYAPPEQRQRHG